VICKNCKNTLIDNSDYCNSCGAKVIRNRLTIKTLFSHFSEQFLNYDNKFIQTFITLFKEPEAVIGNYIRGTRKKYVNVIGYFSIAIMVTGVEYFIINRFFPEFLDMSALSTKEMEGFTNETLGFFQEYQSFFIMLFIPVYALMAKIVFFNIKKFNYTEHLVIFMYIIGQLSVLGSLIIIPSALLGVKMGLVTPFVLVLQIAYSAYCLKRLYSLSIKGIFLRTLLFLAVLIIFYIISIILVMTGVFIFEPEWFKELREAQKAFKESTSG
jgi:hypothetical protein